MGAGGTGKGTMAKKISDKYSIELILSPVQEIGELMFPDVKNYSDIPSTSYINRWTFQYASAIAQIHMEKFAALNDLDYITERSVFDFLAYADYYSTDLYKAYETMILKAYERNPYDIVFYIPYDDFTPTDKKGSPWKERDEYKRKKTDAFIRKMLDRNIPDASYVYTVRGTLEERMDFISKKIEEFFDQI